MSGFWIVSAGWLCARAPNGRQAIRVGCCEVGWFLRGWFLCCLPLQGKQATCAQPPSGASERAQEDDEAPPCSAEPSPVARPAGKCGALGPSGRRGRGGLVPRPKRIFDI